MAETLKPVVIGSEKVVDETSLENLDELSDKLNNVVVRAKSVEISDENSYNEAVELLDRIDETFSIIEEIIERFRKPAYDYYKQVLEQKKEILGPGEEAKEYIRKQLADYKVRQEEERRKNRQKELQRTTEQKVRKMREEFARSLEEGDEERAEEIMEKIASGDVDVELPEHNDDDTVPERNDIHYRESWQFQLENPRDSAIKKLCGAIASGDVPTDAVKINKSRLNKLARQLKGELNVPGGKAVKKVYPVKHG